MLTDEVKIKVMAGRGGDGLVTFDKSKFALGPTGGRGGNGGDVYLKGVSDIFALNKYKGKREYWAPDGKKGGSNRKDGARGEELILTVPIGTVAQNIDTQKTFDITQVDQTVLIAKGGLGGRGNFYFRSPTNTSPQEAEEGKPGEIFNFRLELRLIADIGLVGFPNAGKSSLLNELTKADVKVADYPFTTLEPNLGTLGKIIIADIPGLIEDAHKGKGLGIKFLKHIERTRVLAHCISLESDNIVKDYKTIRKELANYSPELVKREEIVILTKTDLINPSEIKKKERAIKKINPETYLVSIHDYDSLEILKHKLTSLAERNT